MQFDQNDQAGIYGLGASDQLYRQLLHILTDVACIIINGDVICVFSVGESWHVYSKPFECLFLSAAGADYVYFGPIKLFYRGGRRQESEVKFDITIIDDDIPEPTESFEISGLATKNLYFPFPVMTVTILDNEAGKIYD